MKIRWFLLTLLLGLGIVSYLVITQPKEEKPSPIPKHGKETIGTYFFPVPISKFTSDNLPCLSVQIGDLVISSELDLGFRGDIDLSSDVLNQIQEKVFLGEKTMYGFRGNAYKKTLYRTPKVKIGNITFSNAIMHGATNEFTLDSTILKEENSEPTPRETGRIGWQLFRNANLFLDLGNSQIVFCDSAASLAKHGYSIQCFVKIPLHSDRGFIEFEASTQTGPLICSLDTGSTFNILNTENQNGKTIEEMAFDPAYLSQITLQIKGIDFGPIEFHRLPIRLPIKIDAMLGMEFFMTHQVFIDFAENQIYIRPLPPKTE